MPLSVDRERGEVRRKKRWLVARCRCRRVAGPKESGRCYFRGRFLRPGLRREWPVEVLLGRLLKAQSERLNKNGLTPL